jgi:hypothetical protein
MLRNDRGYNLRKQKQRVLLINLIEHPKSKS